MNGYKINIKNIKPISLLSIWVRGKQMPLTKQEKLKAIEKAIEGIQFGEVQITIQDGVIVQINRVEKQRFHKNSKHKISE